MFGRPELTSKSLKAARLFRPCTLALTANLSFFCRACHRFEDEEEECGWTEKRFCLRSERPPSAERACHQMWMQVQVKVDNPL